ncbi:transposase [Bacillus toyonensis]|uniref:transposase n=1 Tax=Bacillus toyonensis TaxID=155322 RepID=UPI00369C2AF2
MARGKCYEDTFIKYILENNKVVAQVAREAGVNENTLHGWVKKYGQKPEIKTAQTFSTPKVVILNG